MATAPWFFEQFRDVNGSPLAGGKLWFFVAGSTVLPKAVYADYGLTTPLTQPLILDGSGNAPEYFMESGLYKILVRASDDRLIATRDNVEGVGGGGSPGTDSYQFKISGADAAPGYGEDKLGPSTTIVWTQVDVGGGVLQLRPSVVLSAVLDYKVKGDTLDTAPGYLDAKVENGDYISLNVNPSTHRLRADFTGPAYVARTGGSYTGPVTFEGPVTLTVPGTGPLLGIDVAGNLTRVVLPADDHLVLASPTDTIPGALGVKLQAGAGLQINTTVDGVNGEVMHISSIYIPATAPLHQVMSGDGAGGVLSSPNFTAIDGDVVLVTLNAGGTGTAITVPNGAVLVRGVAEISYSAWAGAAVAWYGLEGHNPPTNDGTIAGMMVGAGTCSLYAPNGGSASLGTGMSRLAVYSSQAAIDVPFSGPAFHSTDYVILTGASYTSVYHAIIAFGGTGTTFVAPAGNSLNTSLRLSNSTAVGIAITGVATPFTLPAGASRDLTWDIASVTPKWW